MKRIPQIDTKEELKEAFQIIFDRMFNEIDNLSETDFESIKEELGVNFEKIQEAIQCTPKQNVMNSLQISMEDSDVEHFSDIMEFIALHMAYDIYHANNIN